MEQQPVTLPISKAIMKAKLKNMKKSVNNNMLKFKPDADTKKRIMEFFANQCDRLVMKYGDKIDEAKFYEKAEQIKGRCFRQIFDEVVTLRGDVAAYQVFIEELKERIKYLENNYVKPPKAKLCLDQDSDEEDKEELADAKAQIEKLINLYKSTELEAVMYKDSCMDFKADVESLQLQVKSKDKQIYSLLYKNEDLCQDMFDMREQVVLYVGGPLEGYMCEIFFESMDYAPATCIMCMVQNVPCYNLCLDHMAGEHPPPAAGHAGLPNPNYARHYMNWFKIQYQRVETKTPVCMICVKGHINRAVRKLETEEDAYLAECFKCVHRTHDKLFFKSVHELALIRLKETEVRTPGVHDEGYKFDRMI